MQTRTAFPFQLTNTHLKIQKLKSTQRSGSLQRGFGGRVGWLVVFFKGQQKLRMPQLRKQPGAPGGSSRDGQALASEQDPTRRVNIPRVRRTAAEGLAAGEGEGRRWHTLLRRPLGVPVGRAAAGTGKPQGSVCGNGALLPADSFSAFPLGHLWCWQHRLVHRSNLPQCSSPLSTYQT